MKKTTREFLDFLKEFKVASLAIAFIMGGASTALINSFVKDMLMPILAPIISSGSWKTAILQIGPIKMAYGNFLAELLNFVILALIIFFVTKKLLKTENNKK